MYLPKWTELQIWPSCKIHLCKCPQNNPLSLWDKQGRFYWRFGLGRRDLHSKSFSAKEFPWPLSTSPLLSLRNLHGPQMLLPGLWGPVYLSACALKSHARSNCQVLDIAANMPLNITLQVIFIGLMVLKVNTSWCAEQLSGGQCPSASQSIGGVEPRIPVRPLEKWPELACQNKNGTKLRPCSPPLSPTSLLDPSLKFLNVLKICSIF